MYVTTVKSIQVLNKLQKMINESINIYGSMEHISQSYVRDITKAYEYGNL